MESFLLEWDKSKKKYEQLYEFMAQNIRDGKWQENEKLPSKRQLADFLHMSVHTIETAYDMLLEEGYIYSKPQVGFFVAKINLLTKTISFKAPIAVKYTNKQYQYDFRTNAIDTTVFPFATWGKLTRGTMSYHANLLLSGEAQGDYSLRESICEYLEVFRGVHSAPEQIVIGAGMEYLLFVLTTLLPQESVYALENPGYYKTYNFLKNSHHLYEFVSVDADGMCLSELQKSQANVVYLTPSHQFPTGAVMPIGRRIDFLNWAEDAESRYIIEDDYDSEFRLGAKPISAIQGLFPSDKVIYVSTFSRTLAPSIRVAYMVLPHSLLQIYEEKFRYEASTVSRFEQHTLDKFIREGYFVRYLNRARKVYRKKKDWLTAAIKSNLKAGSFCLHGADYGLHLLLELFLPVSEKEIIDKAREQSIKIHGLSQYWLKSPLKKETSNPCLVLGYAGMSQQEIEEGIKKLAGIIQNLT